MVANNNNYTPPVTRSSAKRKALAIEAGEELQPQPQPKRQARRREARFVVVSAPDRMIASRGSRSPSERVDEVMESHIGTAMLNHYDELTRPRASDDLTSESSGTVKTKGGYQSSGDPQDLGSTDINLTHRQTLSTSPRQPQHRDISTTTMDFSDMESGLALFRPTAEDSRAFMLNRDDTTYERFVSIRAEQAAALEVEKPSAQLREGMQFKMRGIPYKADTCAHCLCQGHLSPDCTACLKCKKTDHITRNCLAGRTFHSFMKLGPELRLQIYTFALASDRPINPHLCDGDTLKFHDDNQKRHDAINALLGITKVSRQIRNESLPVFYSANTFEIGNDTTTYFDRLEHLGRFQLIRNVEFDIEFRTEASAARILRLMKTYINRANTYESELRSAAANDNIQTASPQSTSALVGASSTSLRNHPQYLAGGVPELNKFITLRKLTSSFTSAAVSYTQKLFIPVPRAAIFTDYPTLAWFRTVSYGLGIQLAYAENVPLTHHGSRFFTFTWRQKYQKKEFKVDVSEEAVRRSRVMSEEVGRRALEMFPLLESMSREGKNCYMRANCGDTKIEWFDVETEGGWVP